MQQLAAKPTPSVQGITLSFQPAQVLRLLSDFKLGRFDFVSVVCLSRQLHSELFVLIGDSLAHLDGGAASSGAPTCALGQLAGQLRGSGGHFAQVLGCVGGFERTLPIWKGGKVVYGSYSSVFYDSLKAGYIV